MRICAIGDPCGSFDRVREVLLSGVDLILLTGGLGSANLMRKMAFENVERKKQGLKEIEHSTALEKRAFMEAYTSTMKIIRYLKGFFSIFTIFGNAESSNMRQ